jgi:predicted dehydrogenase
VTGLQRVVVTEPDHPSISAWWPPGHVLGWDHTFTIQAADLVGAVAAGTDPTPTFAEGLQVQRVLAAIEASSEQQGARVDVRPGTED